ncbi:MAG: hypothetical protein WEC75_14490 [Dehalococcoidia bacterium]
MRPRGASLGVACSEGEDRGSTPTLAPPTPAASPVTPRSTPPAAATPTPLPPAVGRLDVPLADQVTLGFSDPGEAVTLARVESGDVALVPGHRVHTNERGEAVLFFTGRGLCSLYHNTLVEIRPGDELFTFPDASSQEYVFCSTEGGVSFESFGSRFGSNGTTWGVLYDASGLHIDLLDGGGFFKTEQGGGEEIIAPVSVFIGRDGDFGVTDLRELSDDDIKRLDSIGGSIATPVQ